MFDCSQHVGSWLVSTEVSVDKSPTSLEQIRTALQSLIQDEAKFCLLNTRLILRTGVNLADIKASQASSPAYVAKVLGALDEMGYSLRKGSQENR
jgi:hypothetical protein